MGNTVKTLFHGSDKIIDKPSFGAGKKANDYGQGFYCTEDKELANEWACRHKSEGFCNQYTLSMEGLSVLNLNSSGYNVLNWLALLLKNREFGISNPTAASVKEYILANYLPDLTSIDVIIGYRADDSYFDYAKSFVSNSLPLSKLEWILKNGNLGLQLALVSEKAFENLSFVLAESVSEKIYYPLISAREKKAKSEYLNLLDSNKFDKNEIYAIDIIRNEMSDYVPRISEV